MRNEVAAESIGLMNMPKQLEAEASVAKGMKELTSQRAQDNEEIARLQRSELDAQLRRIDEMSSREEQVMKKHEVEMSAAREHVLEQASKLNCRSGVTYRIHRS